MHQMGHTFININQLTWMIPLEEETSLGGGGTLGANCCHTCDCVFGLQRCSPPPEAIKPMGCPLGRDGTSGWTCPITFASTHHKSGAPGTSFGRDGNCMS